MKYRSKVNIFLQKIYDQFDAKGSKWNLFLELIIRTCKCHVELKHSIGDGHCTSNIKCQDTKIFKGSNLTR